MYDERNKHVHEIRFSAILRERESVLSVLSFTVSPISIAPIVYGVTEAEDRTVALTDLFDEARTHLLRSG